MKAKWSIRLLILGMILVMPSIALGQIQKDSLILHKVFSFKRNYSESINGTKCNIYMKYGFNTIKRNPTLFLIPTMYTIAKGSHNYLGETLGQIQFLNINKYEINKQVSIGNIPHYRKIMPVMFKYTIPNIYGRSLFNGNLLSPFNKNNKKFYRYSIYNNNDSTTNIYFFPRIRNTQLATGHAVVDNSTGSIISASFAGEHDMLNFITNIEMKPNNGALIPSSSETNAIFKFSGNHIETRFSVLYHCPRNISNADSIYNQSDIDFIKFPRPDSLNGFEKSIYRRYYQDKQNSDTVLNKSESTKYKFTEIAWDLIGDYMINSTKTEATNFSVRLSPLLNPLYMSYSHNHGLSYKMKINAQYSFAYNKYISFNPNIGYNFKINKVYITAPIRYTYNSKYNRWIELLSNTGNRITNSSVLDIIKEERRDTLDFSSLDLDFFDDNLIKFSTNTNIGKKLALTLGCTYHIRNAINKDEMSELNKPTSYRSFAPHITIIFHPNNIGGPILTANYERSISRLLKSNMEFERYEFDISLQKKLEVLRQYKVRAGCGFYTNQSTTYFIDFTNFRENYLPDDMDDWTGKFHLLNSQWYNSSKYYFRTNMSYESPLLLLTWFPFVGKYIEVERLYLSALQIEHTRPYMEIGYSLRNRYFSIGIFGSCLNGSIHEIGSKFTLELFRRW